MRLFIKTAFLLIGFLYLHPVHGQNSKAYLLKADKLNSFVNYFNSIDDEEVKNYIPNDKAFGWLSQNIPLFDCPDSILLQNYYYRWWTFRKHLKETPQGFIFTEFITPVKHAAKYNAISCALGHHIYEGRWLHDPQYINQYVSFWLFEDKKEPKPRFHQYSSWVDDALYQNFLVNQNKEFLVKLLPALDEDYMLWETEKQLPDGMFWQFDVRDGMEESMSGSRKEQNKRPTINSYMYGNAMALVEISKLAGVDSLKRKYEEKSKKLKVQVQTNLWDEKADFFKTRLENGNLADPREAIGFIPWYFNLPEDNSKYTKAWDQVLDTLGFKARWGLTTAERRNPTFRTRGSGHGCEWDGAIWPFATTQTLKGMSNLLTNYKNHGNMTKNVFYDELHKYAWSHQKNGQPYLGEYQDETTGYWLKGDNPRSSFYNHSGFVDLIINDLIGLKPRADEVLEINPLIPEGKWDWFCLDNVLYHGNILTIIWDKNGKKYSKGKGMRILSNGKEIYKSKKLQNVVVALKK